MHKLFILTILIFCFVGCSDNSLNSNILDVKGYTGITVTGPDSPDPIGIIDINDWLPISELNFKVLPAYPNPASVSCSIRFSLSQSDSVQILIDDHPINRLKILADKLFNAGTYSFEIDFLYNGEFSTSKRSEGIARIFFKVFHNQKIYQTFGDVKFQY